MLYQVLNDQQMSVLGSDVEGCVLEDLRWLVDFLSRPEQVAHHIEVSILAGPPDV